MDIRKLLAEIDRVLPDGGTWCEPEKAHVLASIVIALRPQFVVEIGVFQGGSLIPMLLAMQHVDTGIAIAIDAWSADASAEGQDGVNRTWWTTVDHAAVKRKFLARLDVHGLRDRCIVIQERSDRVDPPAVIDLFHCDGNHGPAAITDVERFGSRVSIGGIMILDDLDWTGSHVQRARELARDLGFVDMYRVGTGIAMQRRAMGMEIA
jgi:predicted O-methyltransferase YrrM